MHLKPAWAGGRRKAESRKGERGEGDKQGNPAQGKRIPVGQSHQSGPVGDPHDKGRRKHK